MRNGSSSKQNKSKTDSRGSIERGSGNVFADLGLLHPEIALAKAELVQRIRQVIAEKKLTQSQAADLLGIDQPKVSALLRGSVDSYTLDRMMRYLGILGQRIEISVRGASRKPSAEPLLRVVLV